MVGIIKIGFLIAAAAALVWSQDESISLSWALFLCLVSGVFVVGVFAWEPKSAKWEGKE